MSVTGVPISGDSATLSAVNEMLEAIGEAPVDALDTGGTSSEGLAEATLNRVSRRVQQQGFTENTRYKVETAPDVSDNIALDSSYIRVTVNVDKGPWKHVAMRNGYLYDLTENTDEFDDTLYLDIVEELAFTSCSEELQRLIIAQACVDFYLAQIGRGDMYPVLEKRLADARADMLRHESDVSGASLRNRPLNQQAQGIRPGPYKYG